MEPGKIALDLLLGNATCAECGDALGDGDLVAALGDSGADAPWCLDCVRELLHLRADERPQLTEVPAAGLPPAHEERDGA
jgi:hypothetical protein